MVAKIKNTFKVLFILKIAMILFSLISLAFLSGCFYSDSYSSEISNSISSNEKLNITNIEMVVDYNTYLGYSVNITGVAKNLSGKTYTYASVEFSIYDEEGNNLGIALDNINYLSNGDTWKFNATLLSFSEIRPESYKLANITTF